MSIQKMYNPLIKFIRRKGMAIYYFTGAMTMIPVGFAVFLWGMDKGNYSNKVAGAILIVLAVILWIVSLRKAETERKDEKKERDAKHQELLETIRGIKKP